MQQPGKVPSQQDKEAGRELVVSLGHFSVTIIKHHDNNNLKKEGLILASGFRKISIIIHMKSHGTRAGIAESSTSQATCGKQKRGTQNDMGFLKH